MKGNFTVKAEAMWVAISPVTRERLIRNVWCVHCSGETGIVDFSGVVESGNLVLEGSCAACGEAVARVIEGA